MALVLKINTGFSSNCKTLLFYDITGDTASGAYGVAGNPDISTVLTSTLGVRLPDGTIIAPFSVYPTLPNLNNLSFSVPNTMLGLQSTTPLPSGAYVFNYTITGDNGSPYTYTTQATVFIACTECCCRDKFAAKVSDCGCDCDEVTKKQFSDLWDDYELMMDAAGCGHYTQANEFLLKIQLQCQLLNCNCN